MHCASCAALIRDISGDIPAITKVEVDLTKKTVTIEHREDFDLQRWIQEVESLGDVYKVQTA